MRPSADHRHDRHHHLVVGVQRPRRRLADLGHAFSTYLSCFVKDVHQDVPMPPACSMSSEGPGIVGPHPAPSRLPSCRNRYRPFRHTVRNLSFSYAPDDGRSIEPVLFAKPGDIIGIAGPVACGVDLGLTAIGENPLAKSHCAVLRNSPVL